MRSPRSRVHPCLSSKQRKAWCSPARIHRGGGDCKIHLGAQARLTPHVEMAADKRGALAHAGQAEVSGPLFAEHRSLDALAVVSYPYLELLVVVPDFHFDPARLRVPEGITQSLAGDPVDVVPENRVK